MNTETALIIACGITLALNVATVILALGWCAESKKLRQLKSEYETMQLFRKLPETNLCSLRDAIRDLEKSPMFVLQRFPLKNWENDVLWQLKRKTIAFEAIHILEWIEMSHNANNYQAQLDRKLAELPTHLRAKDGIGKVTNELCHEIASFLRNGGTFSDLDYKDVQVARLVSEIFRILNMTHQSEAFELQVWRDEAINNLGLTLAPYPDQAEPPAASASA